MPDSPRPGGLSGRQRAIRWAGAILLACSLVLIARQLWLLDWRSLAALLSLRLAAAALAALALCVAANALLARAWTHLADAERVAERARLVRIYAASVWLKYLPGSVFQYLGRQAEAARLGIPHKTLAKSHGLEIALHVVASLAVAAACLAWMANPAGTAAATAAIMLACAAIRRPLTNALLHQLIAFAAFGAAAAIVGSQVLPGAFDPARFAALYLLAWLIGFLAPLAPGGLGVREAALLALTASHAPAAGVLAAMLVLRLASVAADLCYGLGAVRPRQTTAD